LARLKFIETYREVMFEEAGVMKSVLGITMLKNSLILGIGFAVGKVLFLCSQHMQLFIFASDWQHHYSG
jgi:hypothetical protein